METVYRRRGFLPADDPLCTFPAGSPWTELDELGRDLPSMLLDARFRDFARSLKIPAWQAPEGETGPLSPESLASLRLYYVRLGFLASGYVNQVGQQPANLLPSNIAVPLVDACRRLQRPPILSYDGYALYNWKRFDPAGPIALGNLDTLQNFVHLYDEHWFILVHVEREALAADILAAIDDARAAFESKDESGVNHSLAKMAHSVWRQVEVLRRIPERMDPALYFKTFRPYIRFFEHVVYEGVDVAPLDYRGETGAQSSIVPSLVSFLKIPHRPSALIDHLADMRNFMPADHRRLLEEILAMPDVRPLAEKAAYNDLLEAIATFREVHLGWAHEYIQKRVEDPRGTGGTPYVQWLKQLIDETRAHKL
ncbi:MAG TPA: hypothetical protein VHC19_18015 [Pirellulales bacterium]|nr:hypothetical protein [Pirellulales bacterium]